MPGLVLSSFGMRRIVDWSYVWKLEVVGDVGAMSMITYL